MTDVTQWPGPGTPGLTYRVWRGRPGTETYREVLFTVAPGEHVDHKARELLPNPTGTEVVRP